MNVFLSCHIRGVNGITRHSVRVSEYEVLKRLFYRATCELGKVGTRPISAVKQ